MNATTGPQKNDIHRPQVTRLRKGKSNDLTYLCELGYLWLPPALCRYYFYLILIITVGKSLTHLLDTCWVQACFRCSRCLTSPRSMASAPFTPMVQMTGHTVGSSKEVHQRPKEQTIQALVHSSCDGPNVIICPVTFIVCTSWQKVRPGLCPTRIPLPAIQEAL